ncbi:glutamine--fructose-6-phosphate transaminase (isomerizing) [Companilactobacillus sp.]|jgi:glucosamine--fructose-6-phosphate aminotransferase (isomerizing)|uniref:glutamine--fructose-6-phosphate transaminase (isomerizing) n=1 Tax=Companilactobacillus sp. TaxID=2767905 RepID=UPI0025B7E91F|nr:glutamine--fructose-6-phosphate transaminase (isomerizing) [Companilactobacillus sp.]MCH4008745.1 glutamine--fructose-6-phosphate transaminase (isomerizing) [Companilactobacillus sp.]MCH4051076.1 glutamine--fructose-6-phosphate transaminase (isomerizing) [Companilactobacillus sp.]MCH4076688.1 glutamine--fructose-6-phosphate transaminase (isomerizing) [Companilactobacillus sp.]MCH4125263.1 glutamine--fructose-6-phosphate transaminase (isomerizing) [Companilactobacillus sp.]MCH4131803.1 gluta
MCGIVGVVGNDNTTKILLNGLEKLEYRGYDSAGIYVNNEKGKDFLVKEVGKISQLEKEVGPEVQGEMGIGHTRWATHGQPTVENAHPHYSQDNRFYLVHNGVLTNYAELKEKYLSDFKFVSQTDTEVAVQLVDYFATKENMDAESAFRKALSLLEGSYAFAMVDREQPDRIFVAKNKSPLLIGLGDGFNVICSDAMAMLESTHKFVEIHDGEVVILKKDNVSITTLDGKAVQRDPYTVNLDASDISKGTYANYMLKEIDEQPATMRKISSHYFDGKDIKVDQKMLKDVSEADRLYIVAAGTSYNAALVGKDIFENLADVPVDVELASEFGYHMPKLSQKPFFIFLSQSGETADSRQVLVRVNELGYHSLTMTNVPNSTLSREATYTMELLAGPEIAVASTKAYTANIAVEAVLAKAMGEYKGVQLAKDFDLQGQLSLAANAIQTIVDEKDRFEKIAHDYLAGKKDAFYIGRGIDYALSLEASLKLKEISYIHAEGFAAGELKHGTISLIEKGVPVFAYVNDGIGAAHTRGNIQEVEARGGHVLVISSKKYAQEGDQVVLPSIDEMISPIVSVVPAQLIAYYAALERGNDVDKPRNLAKSVTVE